MLYILTTWHYIRKAVLLCNESNSCCAAQSKRCSALNVTTGSICEMNHHVVGGYDRFYDSTPRCSTTALLRRCVDTHTHTQTRRVINLKSLPESLNVRGVCKDVTMVTSLQVSGCPTVCLNTSLCGHIFGVLKLSRLWCNVRAKTVI